jgi:hypothetical protein
MMIHDQGFFNIIIIISIIIINFNKNKYFIFKFIYFNQFYGGAGGQVCVIDGLV